MTIYKTGGMSDAVLAIMIGLALGLLLVRVSSSNTPAEAAPVKQRWACAKGWQNWKKTTKEVSGYTTFILIPSGKSFIYIPQYHPSYSYDKWDCTRWVKVSPPRPQD